MVPFCGVVEHDVENDLEPRGVKRVDHRLEFGYLAPGPPGAYRGGVRLVWSEKPDRVVTPVIGQAAVDQELLRDTFVYREQFDCSNPEPDQMGDGRRVGETRVSAPKLWRNLGKAHRKTFDMDFVKDRVGVRVMRAGAELQVKVGSTTRLRGTDPAESNPLG